MSTGPAFPFPLGRVQPRPAQFGAMLASMPQMAPVAEETYPRASYRRLGAYRWPRAHGQFGLGDCVGCMMAELAEQFARRTGDPTTPPHPKADGPQFSSLWAYYVARKYSAEQGRPLQGEGAIVTDALAAAMKYGLVEERYWPSTAAGSQAYRDAAPAAAQNAPKWAVAGEVLLSAAQILSTIGSRNLSVGVGMDWRGGYETGPQGGFTFNERAIGGHAFTLDYYDLAADQIGALCWWSEDGGFGTKPTGAKDADGNPLPWGLSHTIWSQISPYLTGSAFNRGAVEAVTITSLTPPGGVKPQPKPDPPKPTPDPPKPTPPPDPPAPSGRVVFDGYGVMGGRAGKMHIEFDPS